MPVNVTGGGGLEFHASLDNSDFEANAKKLEDKLNAVADAAVEATARQVEGFKESARQLTESTEAIDAYADSMAKLSSGGGPGGPPVDPELINSAVEYMASLSQETQDSIAKLFLLNQELQEIEETQASLKTQVDSGSMNQEEFIGLNTALSLSYRKIQEEMTKHNKVVDEAIKASSTEIGSIQAKKEALEEIERKFEQLSEADRNNADIGGVLVDQFATLKQEIKDVTLEKLTKSGEKAVTVMQQIRDLKNQIGALQAVDPNDPMIASLVAQTGKLKNIVDDTNNSIKVMGSSTAGLDAGVSIVRGLIGGFTGLRGVVGLFTSDSSKMEKTIANVTSAMAFLNGVQEVALVLQKASVFNTYILNKLRATSVVTTAAEATATTAVAAARTGQAVATTAAATATRSLNLAMLANPAGIVLAAIGALIAAYSYFSESAAEVAEKQKEVNDVLLEGNKIFLEMLDMQKSMNLDMVKEAENALGLAQAQGASQETIYALRKKVIEASKQENQERIKAIGWDDRLIGIMRARMVMRQEELNALLALSYQAKNFSEEEKRRVEALKGEIAAINSLLDPITKAQNAIKEGDQKQAELDAAEAERRREAGIRSNVATAEAIKIQNRNNEAAELVAQKAYLRAKANQELSNVDITSGEVLKIRAQLQADLEDLDRKFQQNQLQRQIDYNQALLNQAREGSIEEANLRIEQLELVAQKELAAANITKQKKAEILSRRDKAIEKASNQAIYNDTKEFIQKEIEDLELRSLAVEKGSFEELQIMKDMIYQKAEMERASLITSTQSEELKAKINKGIIEKSYKAQFELQKAYEDRLYEMRIRRSEVTATAESIKPNATLGSPSASPEAKRVAGLNLLEIERNKILQQIVATEAQLTLGIGDTNKLIQRRVELYIALQTILGNITNKTDQNEKDRLEEQLENVQKLITAFGDLATSVTPLNEGLGNTIALLTSIGSGILSAKKGLADIKEINKTKDKGDGLATLTAGLGVASAVFGVVSTIVGVFNKAAEKRRKDREEERAFQLGIFTGEIEINALYRQRRLEQIRLNDLRIKGIKDERTELLKNRDAILSDTQSIMAKLQAESFKATMDEIQKAYQSGQINKSQFVQATLTQLLPLTNQSFDQLEKLFMEGRLEGRAKELFETLRRLKDEGVDVEKALIENQKRAREVATGTDRDSIVSSLVEGFKGGLRSAADFAATFEDLMKGAILNALKYKVLEEPLKAFYEQFAIDAESGDVLTAEEVTKLRERFNAIVGDAGKKFEEFKKIAGVNFDNIDTTNTMKGAIKGITEEQADLLAGQFGGLRLTGIEIRDLMLQCLQVQRNIETNTARTVVELSNLNRRFDAYETGVRELHVA